MRIVHKQISGKTDFTIYHLCSSKRPKITTDDCCQESWNKVTCKRCHLIKIHEIGFNKTTLRQILDPKCEGHVHNIFDKRCTYENYESN